MSDVLHNWMKKIRYPRFTGIELWVLAIAIVIAVGIQV
jgi:hypothetical protein